MEELVDTVTGLLGRGEEQEENKEDIQENEEEVQEEVQVAPTKKSRAPRQKRVIIPKDSASFFRARAKDPKMFSYTSDGNLQVPELQGEGAKIIELPLYRKATIEELEEGVEYRRQQLESVEKEYDEMLLSYKEALETWRSTGAASDVISAQRELTRLDSLRTEIRSPLRWTKDFKGLSIRQLMPDLFYEVRKVGFLCYGMRLRPNTWHELTRIGSLPTPAMEEGEEEQVEEGNEEAFIFFSSPSDPEHGALSPETMVEFVFNSTKYNSLIQAYEVERITQLGRRKDLGGLFLRSRNPAQIRALGKSVTGDVENPRELWIEILKALLAQHPNYANVLLSTGTDTLVYANPKDTRWGIGLSADDPEATNRSEWKGPNILGQAWQVVRSSLPPEETQEAEEKEVQEIQEGGSGETRYTEHGKTTEEANHQRKNILKGYYRRKGL